MSDQVEGCCRRALQWEHEARVTTDPIAREIYVELGRQWRDMADYFEEVKRVLTGSSRDSCCW